MKPQIGNSNYSIFDLVCRTLFYFRFVAALRLDAIMRLRFFGACVLFFTRSAILCRFFPVIIDLLGITIPSFLRLPLLTFCFDPDGTFLRVGSSTLIFIVDVLFIAVASCLWKQWNALLKRDIGISFKCFDHLTNPDSS